MCKTAWNWYLTYITAGEDAVDSSNKPRDSSSCDTRKWGVRGIVRIQWLTPFVIVTHESVKVDEFDFIYFFGRNDNLCNFLCAESAASALQKRLLVGLNKEMSTAGKDKKEFPAGSGRYIKADQLAALKANAADKSPVILALDLILTFIGSREKALNIFDGNGIGLCVALGEDLWPT